MNRGTTALIVIFLTLSVVGFLIGGLCAGFVFSKYQKTKCIVDGCTNYTAQCSQCNDAWCYDVTYYPCEQYIYNYTLTYNNQNYTKTSSGWCVDEVTCYFVPSNPHKYLVNSADRRKYSSDDSVIMGIFFALGGMFLVAPIFITILRPTTQV